MREQYLGSGRYGMNSPQQKGPSVAFVGISWLVLVLGIVAYVVGVWNTSEWELNEQGYYLVVLMYALFSVVSVQKSVRDKLEGIPVTNIYYGMSWASSVASILFLVIALFNNDLELAVSGFFGMSFTLSLFAAVAVQKNTRDIEEIRKQQPPQQSE
jgi:uncharacterized membrane protein YiaA